MDPEDKIILPEEEEVDINEYEDLFFTPTDEEQELETEIALAISDLMSEYDI